MDHPPYRCPLKWSAVSSTEFLVMLPNRNYFSLSALTSTSLHLPTPDPCPPFLWPLCTSAPPGQRLHNYLCSRSIKFYYGDSSIHEMRFSNKIKVHLSSYIIHLSLSFVYSIKDSYHNHYSNYLKHKIWLLVLGATSRIIYRICIHLHPRQPTFLVVNLFHSAMPKPNLPTVVCVWGRYEDYSFARTACARGRQGTLLMTDGV